MEGIEINVANVGAQRDIILLRVRGYVDTTTSPELQRTISRILDEGRYQLIVDLSAVNYVSSAGWGVFVGEIRGLRENGGDLKLTHLTAEVFEVFEMLEFNRILATYDSLEEAMDDFDFCRGLDVTQSLVTIEAKSIPMEPDSVSVKPVKPEPPQLVRKDQSRSSHGPRIDDADLPLAEKIKKLVVENPISGTWSIKRSLYSPRFGYAKVGYFRLRSLMKRLNLDSKAKRYRYFRSR
jgi:anti-anti-sigma factor